MNVLPFEQVQRETIIKREERTDESMGCEPEKRTIKQLLDYGVICLNKPRGPTSHLTADYVKKILHAKKAGHGGSLDPLVTGVLPVALGRATRAVHYLLKAGKEYVCLMHVHDDIPEEKLRSVMNEFVGKITQLPPVKSAVKRELRQRNIYYSEILEIKKRDVLFKTGCQAGTYIRKLVHDIGQKLGCGAHMAQLIRTKAGPFSFKDTVTLQDVEDAYWFWKNENKEELLRKCIKPVEFAVSHLPKIWILDSAVDTICHGASLKVPGISKFETGIQKEDAVAIMTLKNELIAVGIAQMTSEDIKTAVKGIAVLTHKVFMNTGTYKISQS